MATPGIGPHSDSPEVALHHFNSRFRLRYRLPEVTLAMLRQVEGLSEALADLRAIRADGVTDASCAVIARAVLSVVPRYAIGFVDRNGVVSVQAPHEGDPNAFRSANVVLVNPLGGRDNWDSASRWVRQTGKTARRRELAGLASEERPDSEANWQFLVAAGPDHTRGIILPPDEAFSSARAAEVSYIYDVPVETLRKWRQTYRGDLGARRPGAPRKNR